MTLTERTAYIKGLCDGLDLDKTTKEGKLIAALIELCDDLANTVTDQQEQIDTLHDYIEEIDEDLGEVEEYLYDEEDECDCEDCDCDCDDCDCECDDCDCDDYFEVECPACGEVICFDESIDPEDLACPACGEKFECLIEEEARPPSATASNI